MSVSSKKEFSLRVLSYGLIVSLGGAFYFHALFFGFTYFDDSWFVLDAYRKITETSFSFGSVFSQTLYDTLITDQFYRPIVSLSYLMNAWFGGTGAFVYHLTNLVLHVASACLVFCLFSAMRYSRKLALLGSLIFLFHPLQQQVAVSITGRNDSLLAVFIISAFLIFIRLLEKPLISLYILCNLIFFAALCVKETAVAFLPVCFVYIVCVNRTKVFCRRNIVIGLGWLVVLCVWFILRNIALKEANQLSLFEIVVYMIRNIPAVIMYVGKVLFPVNLSVWPTLRDSKLVYGIIAITVIVGLLLFPRKARRAQVIFGVLWFLFFLAPTLIRPSSGAMAYFLDQRMYLPMIGLLILLFETALVRGIQFKKISHRLTVVSVMFILIFLSYQRSFDFQDRAHFWENARKTSPHTWHTVDESVQVEITVK